MADITLYGTPISTYVRTVRLLLAEANIEYDLKDIGIFNGDNETEDYLAKNPFGKVPTLEVGGEQLYEVAAITFYINQALAAGKYSPADLWMQARMRQIMSIVSSYLYAPTISTIVIQRLIVPGQGGQTDEEAVKAAIAPAQTALKAIEDLITGSPFLMGSVVTIADFYLIPIFVYLEKTPEFEAVTAQTPQLQTWWNNAKTLPSVQQICA